MGNPRPFRNLSLTDVPGSQPVALPHEGFVTRRAGPVVFVPAGTTKLVILDEPLASSSDAVFLRATSDVEGLVLWPIDSSSPDIDPETRAFGWLWDNTDIGTFVHDHNGGEIIHQVSPLNYPGSDENVNHGDAPEGTPSLTFSGDGGADLRVDAVDNTLVYPVTYYVPSAYDVGRTIQILGGGGWTSGNYVIQAIVNGRFQLLTSPGAVGLTLGNWSIGDIIGGRYIHGEAVYHDNVFPVVQTYEQDAPPRITSGAIVYAVKRTAAEVYVGIGGKPVVLDEFAWELTEGPGGGGCIFQLLLGPAVGQYLNLGTANDGLEFQAIVGVEDGAVYDQADLGFYCYPYTETLVDPALVPATNPIGHPVWGVNDVNLCRASYIPDGGGGARASGWDLFGAQDMGAAFAANDSDGRITGWSTVRWAKNDFSLIAANTNVAFAGLPTWRRITMIGYRLSSDTKRNYLAGIWFGPRPGLMHVLRPYCYLTGRYWGAGSKPAVGIQNTTDRDAFVHLEYGAKEA